MMKKQPEQAMAEGERAIALNPNYADGYVYLGYLLIFDGKPEAALPLVQQALRLNPHPLFLYSACSGSAYYLLQRYEEAIAAFKSSLALNPNNATARVYLAISYIESGQKEEVRAEMVEGLRLSPLVSPKQMRQRIPYSDPAVSDRVFESMRKALATLRLSDYVFLVKDRVTQYFR